MAEKKSSGFGTFLLIIITIALALAFSFAAYLMLVPNSTLFGLQYASNTKQVVIERADGDGSLLDLSSYSKIVVNANNGKGHTNVQVNYGDAVGMVNSQIVLYEGSRGFTRVDSPIEYSFSVAKSGSTLVITVNEPEYNFLQISNNTILAINIYESDNMLNKTIEINTGSGSVTFGGASSTTAIAKNLTFASANVKTTSGSVLVKQNVTINASANLVTESGKLNIVGEKTIPVLTLESNTGKISTNNLVGDVTLKSYNSHISLGNVVGGVQVDMESGILHVGDITGNLFSENHMIHTSVNVGKVTGTVTLVNDDGNFSANIKETVGDVAIRTGNKDITIEKVGGKCSIQTLGGSINVTKSDSNLAEMILTATGNGSIQATFNIVLGKNTITTENGNIAFKFGTEAMFHLKASSTNGGVNRTWLYNNDENPVDDSVGPAGSANSVILESTNGQIKIEKV